MLPKRRFFGKGGRYMAAEGTPMERLLKEWPLERITRGREYWVADRVRRRVRAPGLYLAEVEGYRDIYHAGVWDGRPRCSCQTFKGYCAHVAAVLLALHEEPDAFRPWPLAFLRHAISPTNWAWDQPFPWQEVPETPSRWQLPASSEAVDALVGQATGWPLDAPESLARFAEAHPTWWEHDQWQTLFRHWTDNSRRLPPDEWLVAAWYNPDLPIWSVWLRYRTWLNQHVATLLAWLFSRHPWWPATPSRQRYVLTLLTLAQGAESHGMWEILRPVDPYHLAEADALYLAGEPILASQLLEQYLPEDSAARHQARERIQRWNPDKYWEHRLADILETGAVDELNTLRQRLPDEQWEMLTKAIEARRFSGAQPARESE